MHRKNYILFLVLFASTFVLSQNVSKDEIKTIKNANKNNLTYSYNRYQTVEISTQIWNNSDTLRKEFVKRIFPKVYDFLEANSTVKIELSIEGVKKNKRIKEKLIESKSTGIKRPKMISLMLQNEYSDLNYKVLKISGKKYYNPLYYYKKYNFKSTTLIGDNGELCTYQFTPKKKKKHVLEGYFYCNKLLNIEYFKAFPSLAKKGFKSNISIENEVIDSTVYPKFNITNANISSKQNSVRDLSVNSSNEFENIKVENKKLKTSNIVLDFDQQKVQNDTLDDSSLKINKTLNYLEGLRYGRLGINKFDILLKHLISYNLLEGFRFGLGAATNEKFSAIYDFGGYIAYGTADNKMKFGVFNNIYFHKKTNTKLKTTFINDLIEPGSVQFPFSKRIFLNEDFRKYGQSKLDFTNRLDIKVSTTLLKNIFLETGFTHRYHSPAYDYQFHNQTRFEVEELNFGIRYNPDEKFFKINNRLHSLGSKYPSLFVNYTKSINSFYDYHKIDFKIEKNIKLIQLGEVDFQIIGGYISKDILPYPLSYNMKGSFKSGTPVINNSFGTMGYNEFVATKYGALFYNHNIGKIANRETFAPELVLIQNMGLGNTINIIQHKNIELKSMERGYYESGFYLKNLFSFQNIVGQTGFGMGFMYRYGSYAHPKELDNLVFKFSLDIDI